MSDNNPAGGSEPEPASQPVYVEPGQQKKSPMGMIIGLLVAVLLIVAIIAIVSNSDDGDSSDTSPPGTGVSVDIDVGTDDSADPPATDGG